MQKFDFHMHTKYCDGNNTVAEMVAAAVYKGLEVVGLSGHSYTPHDESYCMSKEDTERYFLEIESVALRSPGIKVLRGLEMDYYADENPHLFDYIVGSVHYIMAGDDWVAVDEDAESLVAFAEKHFGGDMLALAEAYFETEGDVVGRTDCDIIGHFDLITKFIEKNPDLIDTEHPRYKSAWKKAIHRIFKDEAARYEAGWENRLFDTKGKPVFEINTGAISRGYRTTPYPSMEQIEYIKSLGGILILSSDSHSVTTVAYKFDEFAELASDIKLK